MAKRTGRSEAPATSTITAVSPPQQVMYKGQNISKMYCTACTLHGCKCYNPCVLCTMVHCELHDQLIKCLFSFKVLRIALQNRREVDQTLRRHKMVTDENIRIYSKKLLDTFFSIPVSLKQRFLAEINFHFFSIHQTCRCSKFSRTFVLISCVSYFPNNEFSCYPPAIKQFYFSRVLLRTKDFC